MPPLRSLAILAAAGALAGTAALTPWSLGTPRAVAFVGAELTRSYGLTLAADGATTLALLPAPRLTFRGATVRDASGAVLVEADALSAQLGLAALVLGRAEVTEVAARGARIVAPAGEAGPWADTLERITDRLAGRGPHLRRLSLRDATILRRDARTGAESVVAQGADLTLGWPRWSSALDVTGTFTFAGVRVAVEAAGLRPADLAAGRATPASLRLRWPSGGLTAQGSASLGSGQPWRETRWTGEAQLDTRSLRESLAWLGMPAALAPLIEGLTMEASFEAGVAGLVMPKVRARIAGATLDGAGGAGFVGGRLALSATLATDTIDLSRFLAPVAVAFVPGAEWSREALGLTEATGGDLDLRISAASAQAGPLRLEDVAAALLVKEGEIEASLGRATLRDGTLKGRLVLSDSPRGTEVRLQGAFQRVDLGGVFADLGQPRWVSGAGAGQVALESVGATPADLAAGLSGRIALAVEGGEIGGLSLEEVARTRAGPERRAGRTPFERTVLALGFTEGVGEITEGQLRAPGLLAGLRGRISLPARSLGVRAEIAPREGAASLFDIAGPWARIEVEGAPPNAALVRPWRDPPPKGPVPANASAFAP